MGFRLNLKWVGLSVQSPISTTSSAFPSSSYSCRCKDSSNFLARLSSASLVHGETETLSDISRAQMAVRKGSGEGLYSLLDDNIQISNKEDESAYLTSLQATQASQFKLLMKNLDTLDDMFTDSDAVRLERDILKLLERLGALRYFHSCLSRTTLQSSTLCHLSNAPTELVEEPQINNPVDNHSCKVVVQSGKKELRKLRRKRILEKESGSFVQESPSKTFSKHPQHPTLKRPSRSRNKRQKVARNEAEMSSGIKLVAKLEKIRMTLEEELGEVASLSSWAEAARVEKKELQQHLHYGWHCRDELLRSTRSLVLFIARNYWGHGVAFEDLIQAGNIGVLQGAERFDQSRGYKFSTYVQYWIRKSMSTLITRHARGIRIPCTLSKVINQVQKARKALSSTGHGKYPDDSEIAKLTGLSVAKIMSANKCLRVVGSIDQNIGDGISIKFLEVTPDTSITSPEETVMRQQMIKNVYTLLINSLEPKERQVLILRFGLGNHQSKSLEEIGRLCCVSKEWIRKIERSALTKLRNEDSLQILSHYVYMQ